jgi:hypothetical protein
MHPEELQIGKIDKKGKPSVYNQINIQAITYTVQARDNHWNESLVIQGINL